MKKPKVFLVEDNQAFSLILDYKLRDIALCELDVMETGEECLERLYLQPDVIILDYNLPGISGYETLVQIKKNQPHIPVLFLSGDEREEIARQCLEAGAAEFIIKDMQAPIKVYDCIVKLLQEEAEPETVVQSEGPMVKFFKKLGWGGNSGSMSN